jgi:maltooligosyltrehalose trehalohydrolase
MRMTRRFTVGAEAHDGTTSFRVWAPKRKSVEVLIERGTGVEAVALTAEADGYFSAVTKAEPGTRYKFKLDGGDAFADPASRFQPEGPHGPSQVVDPRKFRWTDGNWRGLELVGQVIYEMHVGTFTKEGTWAAAAEQLEELASLGITCIEVMPIAEFPGRFGWGYDGVNLYAPTHLYGEPDALRAFIDRAHACGIGVILDVVYNHLGPDGNYLPQYSDHYFTDAHATDWGAAVNYDAEDAHGVRSFVIDNAAYWIEEFHFDGLRLDATQNIYDSSPDHVLALISRAARAAAKNRSIILVAENESQDARLARPYDKKGYGLDALWNDDLHHTAKVALTGRREAYYTDYKGSPQELLSCLKHGYLYQGQRYSWQKARRGSASLDLHSSAFVTFLENHDQVSNSIDGGRGHTRASAALWRAMTGLILLAPGTPMLFQGQEFSSSAPFLFFADHQGDLGAAVRKGRADFLAQFPSMSTPDVRAQLDDPSALESFTKCRLDFSERSRNAHVYSMHRELLRIRKKYASLFAKTKIDGSVLSDDSFCYRFLSPSGDADLLAIMNLGEDQEIFPSDPLLAPPTDRRWSVVWTSEDVAWGGSGGAPPEDAEGHWSLTAESLVLLEAKPSKPGDTDAE